MGRSLLIALVFLGTAQAAPGDARERVLTWVLNDFPPFIVVGGERPRSGFVDVMLDQLIARMPEYEHRVEVSSIARALGLMEQGERLCHPALLQNEARLRVAVFSGPVQVVLPHHVIVRRDRLERLGPHLDASGAVRVDRLVADASLVTSITDHRAFPPIIERELARFPEATHLHRTGGQFIASFHQLAAGWIDYLFAYPVEPGWYLAQEARRTDVEFAALPISGNQDFTLGYVACTRGAWGQQVVERIDAVVREAGPRPPWIEHQLSMLDPGSARKLLTVLGRERPFAR